MPAYSASKLFHPVLAVGLAAVAIGWWLSVPDLMTSPTFLAVFGIFAASLWVAKTTIENARPSSSLAQSLHDVEAAAVEKRARGRSGDNQ